MTLFSTEKSFAQKRPWRFRRSEFPTTTRVIGIGPRRPATGETRSSHVSHSLRARFYSVVVDEICRLARIAYAAAATRRPVETRRFSRVSTKNVFETRARFSRPNKCRRDVFHNNMMALLVPNKHGYYIRFLRPNDSTRYLEFTHRRWCPVSVFVLHTITPHVRVRHLWTKATFAQYQLF